MNDDYHVEVSSHLSDGSYDWKKSYSNFNDTTSIPWTLDYSVL